MMRVYEITYRVDDAQSYISLALAESTRQIPELLAGMHGGKIISFEVMKIIDVDTPSILTTIAIDKGLHNQLKECKINA